MRLSSTSTVFFVSGCSVIAFYLTDRANMTRDGAGRKSMSLPFTISDLRQRPEFFDAVADRIWQAWGWGRAARARARHRCCAGRPRRSGLLRARRQPHLSMRAAAAFELLPRAG